MIECKNCDGECCKRLIIPLCDQMLLDEDQAKWLVMHENISIGISQGKAAIIIQTRCENLENGDCKIYENRPDVCKDFPVETCRANKVCDGTELKSVEDVEKYFSHDI